MPHMGHPAGRLSPARLAAGTLRAADPGSRIGGLRCRPGLAQLLIVPDSTIVNIALPAARHDLGS
jgi:hypothetical protein